MLIITVFVLTMTLLLPHVNNTSNIDTSQESTKDTSSVPSAVGNSKLAKVTDFKVDELVSGTNAFRRSNSLPALSLNTKLNAAALAKCNDMVKLNYWSHNDPTGAEPWKFITNAGYTYSTAGENLAYGYKNSTEVLDGWVKSPGHKANLLKNDVSEVGFGVCHSTDYINKGSRVIVVQHLASPRTTQSAPPNYKPKPYVAPVCTKTPIPYKTVYIEVSYLYVGETTSYGGYDGYTETCTASSNGYKPPDYTSPPIDKTVNVGTKPR